MDSGMNMGHEMSHMHMAFYWDKNSEVLFSGWPGSRAGMYALALIVVFILALIVELFNNNRLIQCNCKNRVAFVLGRTAAHAVRVGLAYVLMLAVMSFNVGVLLAAIAGHAAGFLLFSGSVFEPAMSAMGNGDGVKPDLPSMAC